MGGGQDPEADGKTNYASGDLPPSAPPHLQGQQPHQYQYGTSQPPPHAASAEFHFRQPPVGFPQPGPPPGFGGQHQPPQQPYAHAEPYHAQGYQAVQGYGPVVEGIPVRMRRLPCCGLGLGWFLLVPLYICYFTLFSEVKLDSSQRSILLLKQRFIAGFFLAAIPWYIGAFVLICARVRDYREKSGYVACTIAAAIAAVVILLGVTKGTHVW